MLDVQRLRTVLLCDCDVDVTLCYDWLGSVHWEWRWEILDRIKMFARNWDAFGLS